MDVDHASDLNVGARHVWTGAASDDPVANPGDAIPAVGILGTEGIAIAHGNPPQAPAFGSNVYHVDTQGHSGYWGANSESLRNQARVIVGKYEAVTLDSGKAPS